MPEQPTDLESRIDRLTYRLDAIERRLTVLEHPAGAAAAPAGDSAAAETETPAGGGSRWLSTETIQRFGRTFVVLGGAFLLRAATEGGMLPQIAGTVLGLAYAMFWFVMVDRAAVQRRLRSATLHGLAATAIAFPLLWEATVKFRFLTPLAGAAALAAITALGLFVVTRRRLRGLAWLVTLGAAITTLALAFSTKLWALFVFELALLAFVALWMGYERGWRPLAWTVSALTSGTVLLMTAMLLLASEDRVWPLFSPQMLVAIQLSWIVIFFGTLGYRKLATREELTAAEVVLGLLTLIAGFGGAMAVTRATAISAVSLAVLSFVLAAGLYGFAFAFADRELGRRGSFICYGTAALLVTVVASGALVRGRALTVTLCVAALATAWLGARRARATLSLHSTVYIVAASITSGLLSGGATAYASASAPALAWITPWVLLVLAVAGVAFALPVSTHGRTWGNFARAPVLCIIALLAFGVGAAAVTLGASLLVSGDEAGMDAGVLSALRTGVLAAIAVALGWLSKRRRWPEAFWLLYPTLALGAIKLLLVDVRSGRPATLFFSFVFYGGALILAPRLARKGS